MSSVLVPKAGIQTIVPFPVESHLRCGSIPFAKAFLHDHRLTRVHNAFSRTENLAVTKARAREWTATPLHMAACAATAALILQPEFKRNLVLARPDPDKPPSDGLQKASRPLLRASSSRLEFHRGIPFAFHSTWLKILILSFPAGPCLRCGPVTFAKALFHAHSFPVGLPFWRKS